MTHVPWTKPVLSAVAAGVSLLAVYFAILTLVSGWDFAYEQFGQFWYFIMPLAAGFGVQVAIYHRLRNVAQHDGSSGKVVAISGGTSGLAMVSCCAHYLANVLPLLGATAFVTLVAQYQIALFWAGLAFNAAGITYTAGKLSQASRHMTMTEMGRHA